MATNLFSRSQPCSSMPWGSAALNTQDIGSFTTSNTHTSRVSISHWSRVQQARLLANLAVISRDNSGWIFIANAPAPLSRNALAKAGINPARVIDAKQASPQLVEQAMSCPSIAAVVCWKNAKIKNRILALRP